MTELDLKIGQRVMEARLQAGMTRSEISRELGISHQQFEKYEKGMNRISASSLYILSKYFDRPMSWFTEYLDEQHEKPSVNSNFIIRISRELRKVTNPSSQQKLIKMIRFFIKEGL